VSNAFEKSNSALSVGLEKFANRVSNINEV